MKYSNTYGNIAAGLLGGTIACGFTYFGFELFSMPVSAAIFVGGYLSTLLGIWLRISMEDDN